ncbi:hypothetical protein N8873_00560 [Flavobacteriaceae bacterium]|jgi:hypothetical protein|nr:hypothetical protein [Flavobacteriaceae bacterium]
MNELNYLGITIKVKDGEYSVWEGNDGKPTVSINRILASKFIREFIKQRYPKRDFKYWVQSEIYSGGSSVRVYVSKHNGESIDEKIYEEIKSFCNSLKGGDFDGMVDLYTYRKDVKGEDGINYSFSTKYIFSSNKPPYGTKEYDLREQIQII